MTPSRLEKKFAFLWRCLDGLPLEREFRFHRSANGGRILRISPAGH